MDFVFLSFFSSVFLVKTKQVEQLSFFCGEKKKEVEQLFFVANHKETKRKPKWRKPQGNQKDTFALEPFGDTRICAPACVRALGSLAGCGRMACLFAVANSSNRLLVLSGAATQSWAPHRPGGRISVHLGHMAVGQNPVPLVNIKIGGKWMFIQPKMGHI